MDSSVDIMGVIRGGGGGVSRGCQQKNEHVKMLLIAAHHTIVVFIAMEECKRHTCWLKLSVLTRGAMLWRHLAGQTNIPPSPNEKL